MKFWSTKRFAILGSTSFETMKRRKNSYTICKCGHALSRLGSSSSGSEKVLTSLFRICRARKILTLTMFTTFCMRASLKQFRVLFTYSTISSRVWRLASFSRWHESFEKLKTTQQTSIFRRNRSDRSTAGASRSFGSAAIAPASTAERGTPEALPPSPAAAEPAERLFAEGSFAPDALPLLSSLPMRRFTVWMSFMPSFCMNRGSSAASLSAGGPRG
mmetsp:Transcript_40699/g.107852  ORF Transcript_40699/g.107852 Transcript_40699/m.107852 type:complete len:217 (+) Transcript_40699:590-1240(+)